MYHIIRLTRQKLQVSKAGKVEGRWRPVPIEFDFTHRSLLRFDCKDERLALPRLPVAGIHWAGQANASFKLAKILITGNIEFGRHEARGKRHECKSQKFRVLMRVSR